MDEILGMLPTIDRMGAMGTVILFALLIITDKLIWHTRFKAEVQRADRWEKVAIDALTAGAQAGVQAAEVAVGVVAAIPNPQGDRDRAGEVDPP